MYEALYKTKFKFSELFLTLNLFFISPSGLCIILGLPSICTSLLISEPFLTSGITGIFRLEWNGMFKIIFSGLLEINMFNVVRKVGRKAEILTKTTSHIYLCKFTYWSISESYRDHRHDLKNFANVSSFSAKHVIKLAQRNWNNYSSWIDDPTFNISLVALSKKR